MKKLTKVLSVVMITIMMVSCFSTVFAAVGIDPSTEWDGKPSDNNNAFDTTGVSDFLENIISVVSIAGSAIAIIALIILGIKYMMGSAEEKAEYKKTLLPYFFGAIMVFGASLLTGFIFSIVNK